MPFPGIISDVILSFKRFGSVTKKKNVHFFFIIRSLGLAVPPRIRFLQKRQKILAAKLGKMKSEQDRLVSKIEETSEAENESDERDSENISEDVKTEKIDPRKTTYNFYSSV